MAVQKNKKSRSKRDMRRGHDKLMNPTLSEDASGEIHRRHHISPEGMYRGRQVIAQNIDEDDE